MGDFMSYYPIKQQVGSDSNNDTRASPGPRPTFICVHTCTLACSCDTGISKGGSWDKILLHHNVRKISHKIFHKILKDPLLCTYSTEIYNFLHVKSCLKNTDSQSQPQNGYLSFPEKLSIYCYQAFPPFYYDLFLECILMELIRWFNVQISALSFTFSNWKSEVSICLNCFLQ